jgi:hypothetical protein
MTAPTGRGVRRSALSIVDALTGRRKLFMRLQGRPGMNSTLDTARYRATGIQSCYSSSLDFNLILFVSESHVILLCSIECLPLSSSRTYPCAEVAPSSFAAFVVILATSTTAFIHGSVVGMFEMPFVPNVEFAQQ